MRLFYRVMAAIVAAVVVLSAHAQSTVSMYGSIDNGLTYANNMRGKSNIFEQGGVSRVNTFGLTGNEDLGGGLSALFKLENGYSSTTGAPGQGGLLFGKQVYVGLKDNDIGQLSLGRHYDFSVMVEPYMPCYQCGIYAVQNADLDRVAGERFNNSLRFYSANLGGLSFGAMYSFGQNAGALSTNTGRAYSTAVKYDRGPFSAMGVLTEINGAPISAGSLGADTLLGKPAAGTIFVEHQRIAVLAASYHIGGWEPSFTYSSTALHDHRISATDQLLRIGTRYTVSPSILLAAQASVDRMADSRWYMLNLGANYFLSKSTGLYLALAGQRASGSGTAASIFLIGPSSTSTQLVTRIGLLHLF